MARSTYSCPKCGADVTVEGRNRRDADGRAKWALNRGILCEPNGSTAMHIGLRAAIAQRRGRILVVSDGEPDDEASALAAASDYLGTIDVLYTSARTPTRPPWRSCSVWPAPGTAAIMDRTFRGPGSRR